MCAPRPRPVALEQKVSGHAHCITHDTTASHVAHVGVAATGWWAFLPEFSTHSACSQLGGKQWGGRSVTWPYCGPGVVLCPSHLNPFPYFPATLLGTILSPSTDKSVAECR